VKRVAPVLSRRSRKRRDTARELMTKIEWLRKALKNVRPYIANCDHELALDEIDAALKR